MNLFYQPRIPEGDLFLDQEESRHCVKVLRHKSGDEITVTDGNGFFYKGVISDADMRKCSFTIREKTPEVQKNYTIHIAISPTKNNDRFEWFTEKATEFGINTITPLECKHTERAYLKKDRLEKVAVSAMKQSLKASIPVIEKLTTFNAFIATTKLQAAERFIAYVDSTNPHHLKELATPGKNYVVLIGPEGDFSAAELDMAIAAGFKKVSLGQSRLRTETAGIALQPETHARP